MAVADAVEGVAAKAMEAAVARAKVAMVVVTMAEEE